MQQGLEAGTVPRYRGAIACSCLVRAYQLDNGASKYMPSATCSSKCSFRSLTECCASSGVRQCGPAVGQAGPRTDEQGAGWAFHLASTSGSQ